ncbi:hypothetical protein [Streptomyces sp. NPDC088925]
MTRPSGAFTARGNTVCRRRARFGTLGEDERGELAALGAPWAV